MVEMPLERAEAGEVLVAVHPPLLRLGLEVEAQMGICSLSGVLELNNSLTFLLFHVKYRLNTL